MCGLQADQTKNCKQLKDFDYLLAKGHLLQLFKLELSLKSKIFIRWHSLVN